MLDKLHFVSEDLLRRNAVKLRALLKQQSFNLLLGPDGDRVYDPEYSVVDEETGEHLPFEVPTEDITKNLFKLCCAILNLRPK